MSQVKLSMGGLLMRIPCPAFALIGMLAVLPARAAAQRLSIAPEIGVYIPTERLSELAAGSDFSELEAGPTFGGRLGIWFGSRFGIEATGAYVPTTFKLTSGNDVTQEDAKLFLGSGRAVVFLLPPRGLLTVFVNGGVGVVSHGGVAFTDAADKTDIGGVFGVGAGLNLGGIGITAGADLLAYSASFDGGTQTSEKLTQRDFHLKLGLGIPLGPR